MELYNGVSRGTHNIYWGNYDYFSLQFGVDGFSASHYYYYSIEEFMFIVYNTNTAAAYSAWGNLWSYVRIYISSTSYYQLTFGYYQEGYSGQPHILLKGMKKI